MTQLKQREKKALELKTHLFNKINGKVLGPVNASIYRIKKQYRNRLLIRSKKAYNIQKSLTSALKNFKLSSEIKLTVDVDPINFN